VKEAISSKNK